jgi:hypothetical protein
MKASPNKKHLGQSIALGLVFVGTSVGIFALMFLQSGTLQ